MENYNKIIGKWLEEKRNEKGYSLQYVADHLGCTKGAVFNWEKGIRQILAKTFMEYALFLGADPMELVEIIRKTK